MIAKVVYMTEEQLEDSCFNLPVILRDWLENPRVPDPHRVMPELIDEINGRARPINKRRNRNQ